MEKTQNSQNLSKIVPRGKFVLIKPQEVSKKTDSGIFIPDNTEQETKDIGEVIAISDKLDIKYQISNGVDEPTTINNFDLDVGDTVIYSKYAGETIDDRGEIFILIDESEIIAKYV